MSPPTKRERPVHLRFHCALQGGLDVAEQQVGSVTVRLGQLRVESGEDVEIGSERLAIVHVLRVDAGPEKGLAGHAFQARQIDTARSEQIDVFLREIVTHNGDNLRLREKARR